jgi:hypothetical protein
MTIRRRARVAARDGRSCGKCGRQLDPAETVYLVRIGIGYRLGGSFGYWRAPICSGCAPSRALQADVATPCAGCGRGVVYQRSDWRRRWFACSERCLWTARNRLRAERLAEARMLDCAVCGERFHPARSDAVTCSPACRQKAYRRRRAS